MLIFQRQRLTDAEIQQIQYLNEAEFNEKNIAKAFYKAQLKTLSHTNQITQFCGIRLNMQDS